MRASDIRIDPSSGRGVKALKEYLAYAESGQLGGVRFTGREPDSEFEVEVASAVRELGYEAVAQLGVCGYFIDIAVRDPERPGNFLLAVECDGASYHSSRWARDRDLLRQRVLEDLGWTFHRVWSTEWFRARNRQISRLKQALERALSRARTTERTQSRDSRPAEPEPPPGAAAATANSLAIVPVRTSPALPRTAPRPPAPQAVTNALPGRNDPPRLEAPPAKPPILTASQAREELIRLRERVINLKYRHVPREKGLLRQNMLNAFLSYRPTTPDEFRHRMPLHLRQTTDPDQLKEFLGEVLEIVASIVDD